MIGAGGFPLLARGAAWLGLPLLLACAQPAWAQAAQKADSTGFAADTESEAADDYGAGDNPGDVDDTQEIVVTARVGKIAFVFDRRADGKLENCRVFKSSGIPALDETACEDLTDCVMQDNGQGMCDGEIALAARQEPASIAPTSFTMPVPKLVEPSAPKIPAIGPAAPVADENDRNRLGKLERPPSEPATGAIITLGNPDAKRKAEDEKPFLFGQGE